MGEELSAANLKPTTAIVSEICSFETENSGVPETDPFSQILPNMLIEILKIPLPTTYQQ